MSAESGGETDAMRYPSPTMEWHRFVSGWGAAHDGFDIRYAGQLARWWVRCAYRAGLVALRSGLTAGTLTAMALVLALLVPLLASPGGRWPIAAAVAAGFGLLSDAASTAVEVITKQRSKLLGFYRTMVERISELCWLSACAVMGASRYVIAICLVLLLIHEYVRLRAVASGLRAAGGGTIGDRPTRIVMVLLILLTAGVVAGMSANLAAGTTTLLLAVWGLLAVFGLIQLVTIVRTALR